MSDELIVSERLELPLLTLEQLDAVAEGDVTALATELGAVIPPEWVDEVRWLAGFRAKQLRERPQDRAWLLRPLIRTVPGEPREAIGYLNFHMAPDELGFAEIGYTLLPAARGQGFALEAVTAAFAWATREHDVHRFGRGIGDALGAQRGDGGGGSGSSSGFSGGSSGGGSGGGGGGTF